MFKVSGFSTFVMLASLGTLVACDGMDATDPATPEADTGLGSADGRNSAPPPSTERHAGPGREVELGRFEVTVSPADGQFEIRMAAAERLEPLRSDLRQVNQALYCELPAFAVGSPGVGTPESVTLSNMFTVVTSAPFDFLPAQCDGVGEAVNPAFLEETGVLCGGVRLQSNATVPLNGVYAEIDEFGGTTGQRGYAFPYGSGAEPPALPYTLSNEFGLWSYGDVAPGGVAEALWVFKNQDPTDFTFSGRIVARIAECDGVRGPDGIDDDCDGIADNDCGVFARGATCYTDNDCVTRDCDLGAPGPNGIAVGTCAPDCAPGRYGINCEECPGGAGNACNGNGLCSDGDLGDGSCDCEVGFLGASCDTCAADTFGPNCDPCPFSGGVCGGVGTCDDGIAGDGSCTCPNTNFAAECDDCLPGFFGPDCDPCPQTILGVCSGQGVCADGLAGGGACVCFDGFVGTACQNVDTTALLAGAFGNGQPYSLQRFMGRTPVSTGQLESGPPRPASATDVIEIAMGHYTACALYSDGFVTCWGRMANEPQTRPPTLPPGVTWVDIDGGVYEMCGLDSAGNAHCWGQTAYGQQSIPALPPGVTYRNINTQNGAVVAIRSDDVPVHWGHSGHNQHLFPALPGGVFWRDITLSSANTCGLRSDGEIACWGNGSANTVPARPGSTEWAYLVGSHETFCAQWRTTAVPQALGGWSCWGDMTAGKTAFVNAVNADSPGDWQLQPGPLAICGVNSISLSIQCGGWVVDYQTPPTPPAGVGWAVVNSTLDGVFCGARTDGKVRCWGAARQAHYGLGFVPDQSGLGAYRSVGSAGMGTPNQTCFIEGDGELACHGFGGVAPERNLGFSELPPGTEWVKVVMTAITACALRSDGVIECHGESHSTRTPPGAPSGGGTWTNIAAARWSVCANSSLGQTTCWGENQGNVSGLAPAAAGAATTFVEMDAGYGYVCGRTAAGAVTCWGNNNTGAALAVPTLPGGHTWTTLSVGDGAACGMATDGLPRCWGVTASMTAIPALPVGVSWVSMFTSWQTTCGQRSDGVVQCFGSNPTLTGLY